MHESLRDIGRNYGSVYSLPLGHKFIIVLNDWRAIKEALLVQTENFTGRPYTIIFNEVRKRADITGSDGQQWKESRNFTMKTMRNLGFRDVFMEAIIMQEVTKFIDIIKTKHLNKKTCFDDIFFLHLLNIVWGIISGRKFDLEDPGLLEFAEALKLTSITNSNSNVLQFQPYLQYFPGQTRSSFLKFKEVTHQVVTFIENDIDEHEKKHVPGEINDFIDAYLEEIIKQQNNSKKAKHYARKFLVGIMYNFFNGGVDTGNNTLTWAMLYLATWPEVQAKVQEELDRVVGRDRSPCWADRPNLPYTEATVSEIQRYSTIAPLGFPHCVYETTKVLGHTIPKQEYVLANIWAVHNDPKLWGDPENFRPERFINDQGVVEKPEYLIPFSTGRRICIGEALAKMELYLFLTSLLQQFSFSFVPGAPLPSFEPIIGLTLRPHPFSLIIKQR